MPQHKPWSRALLAPGASPLLSTPVRVMCILASVLAALAYVPLGLVLPPGRWVLSTGLAWVTATAGVINLVRRRLVACVTPLVLVAAWFMVQR